MRVCVLRITYTYTYRRDTVRITTQYSTIQNRIYTVSLKYEQNQKRLSNNHFLFLGGEKKAIYTFSFAEKFINIHKV